MRVADRSPAAFPPCPKRYPLERLRGSRGTKRSTHRRRPAAPGPQARCSQCRRFNLRGLCPHNWRREWCAEPPDPANLSRTPCRACFFTGRSVRRGQFCAGCAERPSLPVVRILREPPRAATSARARGPRNGTRTSPAMSRVKLFNRLRTPAAVAVCPRSDAKWRAPEVRSRNYSPRAGNAL